MSSDETILSVDGVSKVYEIYDSPVYRLWQMLFAGRKRFYREFWALRPLHFEVKKGEAVGIVGRNGAGKSTLLKIITGTLRATSGTVTSKGRIAALLELGSGFNPEFTGRENVYMNAALLGLSRSEVDERYKEIASFADIGDFIDQPVKKYSSGMKVRLAFAVQIMVEPDILIVDEALAVGDVFFQQKCLHHMRKLKERGCTLLFVSHSLGTVRSLCDRAILLRRGELVAIGDSNSICNQYWTDNVSGKEDARGPARLDRGASKGKGQTEGSVSQELKTQAEGVTWNPEDAPYSPDPNLRTRMAERAGGGEVEFTGFCLYNDKGDRISTAVRGEKLVVAASLIARKDIPAGTVFGYSVNTKDTQGVLFQHSKLLNKVMPAMRAGDRFVVTIVFVSPFLKGRFFFNFSLAPSLDATSYYDHVYSGLCMDAIIPKELSDRQMWGLVGLDWSRMIFTRHGRARD